MRRVGLVLGLVLALAAVLSWRIPTGSTAPGAQARFTAVAPGELTLAPRGAFLTLSASAGEARGRLTLRNIAGAPLRVSLRARPSSRELDRLLRVRIAAPEAAASGGAPARRDAAPLRGSPARRGAAASRPRLVFRGSLRRLRAWTPVAALASEGRRMLRVRAWLSPGARARAAGALVDVTVELRAELRRG